MFRQLIHTIRKRAIIGFVFLLCSFSANNLMDGNEYNLKAMFILNFMKYVEWPQSKDNTFRIAIAGQSEIKEALITMIKMKPALEGKKIEIITLEEGEVRPCQILFVPNDESKELLNIIKGYQGKGILIITDDNHYASKGAAINLINIDNKIRFEIYLAQAKLAGIKISSKLSELATNVYQ